VVLKNCSTAGLKRLVISPMLCTPLVVRSSGHGADAVAIERRRFAIRRTFVNLSWRGLVISPMFDIRVRSKPVGGVPRPSNQSCTLFGPGLSPSRARRPAHPVIVDDHVLVVSAR